MSSDGSPYEKRADAKGRVLSEKCIADEVPFKELPEGWAWARLEGLCDNVLVPQRDKPKAFGGNIPWCRIEDVNGQVINRSKSGKMVDSKCVWIGNTEHFEGIIGDSVIAYVPVLLHVSISK